MIELEKILYIDDDRIMLDIVRCVLEKDGSLRVDVSATCEEALQKVAVSTPDLILTDVFMPDMDGFAMLRKLREPPLNEDIPTILVTGDMRPRNPQSLRKLGIIDVIYKPFDTSTLAARLRSIWHKQLLAA